MGPQAISMPSCECQNGSLPAVRREFPWAGRSTINDLEKQSGPQRSRTALTLLERGWRPVVRRKS